MALAPSVWRGNSRRAVVVALFVLGLSLGGLLSATTVWLVSGLLTPLQSSVRIGIVLAIGTVAILRDLGVVRFHLPENARQIPRSVFRRGIPRAAVQFGFEMGTGVRTYVPTTVPYVVALALMVLAPSFEIAIITGLGFALGRAAYLVLRLASGKDSAWDSAFERVGRRVSPIGLLAAELSLAFVLLT